MKAAIPVEQNDIFQHFGHAGTFRIYDVSDDGSYTFTEAAPDGSGHEAVADWLTAQGVQLVICGGIGDGAVNALRDAGVLLHSGASGDADKALEEFLTYGATGYDATCSAHDEEGGCGGHCGGGCGGCGGGCGGCGGGMPMPERDPNYVETRTFDQIVTLTKENFDAEVMADEGVIFIDFWAEWCAPCKMAAPAFEELNGELKRVKFCRINVDEQPELANLFGIRSIPTFAVVQARQTLTGFVGACEKQQLKELLTPWLPKEPAE